MAKSDDQLEDVIASGKSGTSMPGWSDLVSSQDIANLVAYLRALAGGEAPAVAEAPTEPGEAEELLVALPAGDPSIGRALFTGDDHLQNGGPPCLACHSVAGVPALGGGTLASDLTSAYDKHGDLGLAGVLADLGFPVMEPIYEGRPLTSDEQAHLRTFLQAAATEQRPQPTGRLGLLAVGGFLVLMALAPLVWRRRLRGVRRSLLERTASDE
jgi:hypothetical protein